MAQIDAGLPCIRCDTDHHNRTRPTRIVNPTNQRLDINDLDQTDLRDGPRPSTTHDCLRRHRHLILRHQTLTAAIIRVVPHTRIQHVPYTIRAAYGKVICCRNDRLL